MDQIVLRKSSKMIVGCVSFDKQGTTLFKIEYVDYHKTGNTYQSKDGITKDELEKVIKFLFVEKTKLPENYQKMDSQKICQEFLGKSIVITTGIGQ